MPLFMADSSHSLLFIGLITTRKFTYIFDSVLYQRILSNPSVLKLVNVKYKIVVYLAADHDDYFCLKCVGCVSALSSNDSTICASLPLYLHLFFKPDGQ